MKRILFFMRYLVYIQFIFLLLIYYQILLSVRCIFRYKSVALWLDSQVGNNAKGILNFTGSLMGLQPVYLNSPKDFDMPAAPFLVISNHQSLFDILLLQALFIDYRVRFVLKESLTRGFFYISSVIKIQRHGAIDRNNPKQSIPELKRLVKYAQDNNTSIVLFPEGTRTRTTQLREFKTAAARTILRKNPMPVIVVGINNGYYAPTVFSHTYFPKKNYYAKILKIYPSVDSQEVIKVLNESFYLIQNEVKTWR